MKKKFDGKRLLILGSNVGAVDIVNYAKENGAYTIVADYYSKEKSEAKQVSDESILVSTSDLETLGEIIEGRKINGILAGISEFNLLNAMKLSERYNLPFYCTHEQWELIEEKDKFRNLCISSGVPCPRTYFTGVKIPDELWGELLYPLVIKPVDACTSAGVHICLNEEELRNFYQDAVENSKKGKIIIEEFVEGCEFTAHYTICNGTVSLSCVDNRYPIANHEGKVTTIPIARIYPSIFTKEYITYVNEPMEKLCKSLKIKDGILFVQGIYNKESQKFWIFEAGLRCAGEAPYRFIREVNGIDFMHVLVDHALLEEADFDFQKEDPFLKGKCCGIVSFVVRGGTVGNITGLEEAVKATSSVIGYENRYPIGCKTPDGDTLRQLMPRFVMVCDSREQMAKDVKYLNENIDVINEQGENMVLKLKPERIFDIF